MILIDKIVDTCTNCDDLPEFFLFLGIFIVFIFVVCRGYKGLSDDEYIDKKRKSTGKVVVPKSTGSDYIIVGSVFDFSGDNGGGDASDSD